MCVFVIMHRKIAKLSTDAPSLAFECMYVSWFKLSLSLHAEITVGLQQTSYSAFETGDPVSICAQIFLGTLERNVSLILTSMDGNATGT